MLSLTSFQRIHLYHYVLCFVAHNEICLYLSQTCLCLMTIKLFDYSDDESDQSDITGIDSTSKKYIKNI